MVKVTLDDINKLITLESGVRYNQPPPEGVMPFVVVDTDSPVLLSAPHGARTFRNNRNQIWHEEDEYTAGIALLLGKICEVSVIATNFRNDYYDPNYTEDFRVSYKTELLRLIKDHRIHYVIDLHGAALNSTKLNPQQTIDLGLRQPNGSEQPSMDLDHVDVLERVILDTKGCCSADCFVVERNKFSGFNKGTITTFASSQRVEGLDLYVQAIQIEMKPQVRVAYRFPTATLYTSCGSYQARPENVVHMVQSIADFIEYLKSTINE